jgi:hypothetical protein
VRTRGANADFVQIEETRCHECDSSGNWSGLASSNRRSS